MNKFSGKVGVIAGLMASAIPCAAWAQDSGAPQVSDTAGTSGEIVVTARRREEALSKVPLAVTAITSELLAAKSIRNENDLQSAVPGLVIKQNGSANAFNYVIRGQTIDTYTNSPPGVLPYINEAQIVSYSASSFYDLGNIQVIKGPQGTLFGRNTTGGAVLYQTAPVKDTFGGYVQGRYGNLDSYQIQGAINIPFSDTVKLRVAASKTGGGAYVHRLDTDKMYGNLEQTSVRGTLLIEPSSNFKNTTVVQHTSDGGTNAPAAIYHSNDYACGKARAIADCFYAGYPYGLLPKASPFLSLGVVGLANLQDKLGPWEVIGGNTDLAHKAKSTFVINTTEYEASSNLKFKNIFMYNESWSNEANDYDGSPFPLIAITGDLTPDLTTVTNPGVFYNQTKQISEEFQIQGKAFNSRLDYTVGFYYHHQSNVFNSQVAFFDFYPLHVYGPTGPTYFPVHYVQESKSDSFAGFAQGTYAVTDQLNLTAGFRYTSDKVQARQLPGSDWYGCTLQVPNVCKAIGTAPEYPQSMTAAKPSWNVTIDYKPSQSLMLYASTRGSWRSGGFNYTLPPNPLPAAAGGSSFAPETTQDIEVGLKYSGRELGFPATFNIDFYNQWVKNIQRGANIISPISGTSILTTIAVPKAVITGVEADFTVSPTPWLSFGGSLAYTNARFTDNKVIVPGNPPLFYGPYGDVPKWSGSAFAEVKHQLDSDKGTLSLRVDYYEQSMSYFSNLNATLIPGTDIAGYRLVNGRLAWANVLGSKITAAAYARNILNQRYYSGGNGTGLSAGFNSAYPGMPRGYGLEVSVNF
jgi:iron complex outermembrane receptor protein